MYSSYLTICLDFFFTREPDITRHYKKVYFVHSQMYCKQNSLVHMFHNHLQKSNKNVLGSFTTHCFRHVAKFNFNCKIIYKMYSKHIFKSTKH